MFVWKNWAPALTFLCSRSAWNSGLDAYGVHREQVDHDLELRRVLVSRNGRIRGAIDVGVVAEAQLGAVGEQLGGAFPRYGLGEKKTLRCFDLDFFHFAANNRCSGREYRS